MRLLVIVALLFSLFTFSASASGGDCHTWTVGMHAYSKNGNYLGCRYTGSAWTSARGDCNIWARAEARKGFRGTQVFYRITARGCAVDDQGVYYSYSTR